MDVVTANSYTVLLPNDLKPEQIEFWSKALDKVLEAEDFQKDLASISGYHVLSVIPTR